MHRFDYRFLADSFPAKNSLMQSLVPAAKEGIAARFPEISITTVESTGKVGQGGKN